MHQNSTIQVNKKYPRLAGAETDLCKIMS